jgi:hypothetical protein
MRWGLIQLSIRRVPTVFNHNIIPGTRKNASQIEVPWLFAFHQDEINFPSSAASQSFLESVLLSQRHKSQVRSSFSRAMYAYAHMHYRETCDVIWATGLLARKKEGKRQKNPSDLRHSLQSLLILGKKMSGLIMSGLFEFWISGILHIRWCQSIIRTELFSSSAGCKI